jgi:type II secretory pathway component GspD/PulD (secretin)
MLPQPSTLCLVIALLGVASSVHAQYAAPAQASSGTVVVQTSEGAPQIIKMEGGKPVIVRPDQPGAKPEEKKEGKEGESKEEKPGEKGEKKEKEEKPSTVKRPTTPPVPPDPTELDIRPDASGKVRFNFRGQPWPDVLDWLAEISGMSLDWQELPGDFLNLVTQQSYTVDEARDLLNRHLLARGFTLLRVGEVLTVTKTENINTALVPRVEPDELAKHRPHEYVKVSFPLDWMTAEVAVEELKPMLSSNAKLTALPSTNRLEAADAVANLRELQAVLTHEQSPTSQERLVREFVLKFARATDVHQQLLSLLGVESKSRGPTMPMSPQQMEMMQQQQQAMMAQMQQQQQQRGGQPPGAGRPKKEPDVNLVVNTRRNSVLATAPPDKMAIIAEAVKVIDVPLDRDQSLLLNAGRMQVYRLAAIDPETLIKALEDSGDLDPTTSLVVDKKNKAIIAYAPLADHLTIRTLVEKLDGSSRKFEVIRLRRLAADYVAGTIGSMMGQTQEKRDERPRYYGYWDDYRSRSSEDQSQDRFRVDADVEGNRLLLWANDIELQEVQNLLVKLGEIPAAGSGQDRVRVLEVDVTENAEQLLDQIRRAWPALAPNELILPPAESLPKKESTEKTAPKPSRTPAEARTPPPQADEALIRFAQLTRDQPDAAAEPPAAGASPKTDPSAEPGTSAPSEPKAAGNPPQTAPNPEPPTPNTPQQPTPEAS